MSSGSYDSTIIATVTQKFREGESILAVSFCLKNVFLILVVRIQLDLEFRDNAIDFFLLAESSFLQGVL